MYPLSPPSFEFFIDMCELVCASCLLVCALGYFSQSSFGWIVLSITNNIITIVRKHTKQIYSNRYQLQYSYYEGKLSRSFICYQRYWSTTNNIFLFASNRYQLQLSIRIQGLNERASEGEIQISPLVNNCPRTYFIL